MLQLRQVDDLGELARVGHLHPRHRVRGGGEVVAAEHEGREVRAGGAVGEGAAVLNRDQARRGCDEGDEAVQRLQGEAGRAAAAQVLERAALDSRRGEGCSACRGQDVIEANHEHCAQISEEVRVEGRAEVAPTVDVCEISLAGCLDNVIVWLLEQDDLAWDERDDIAIDRAVGKGSYRRLIRA